MSPRSDEQLLEVEVCVASLKFENVDLCQCCVLIGCIYIYIYRVFVRLIIMEGYNLGDKSLIMGGNKAGRKIDNYGRWILCTNY